MNSGHELHRKAIDAMRHALALVDKAYAAAPDSGLLNAGCHMQAAIDAATHEPLARSYPSTVDH